LLPLREERADFDYSSSIEIIALLALVIIETLGEAFCLVVVKDILDFCRISLQNLCYVVPSS